MKMKWPIKASIAMTLVLFISACATQEEASLTPNGEEAKVEEATAEREEQTAEVAPAEAEVTSSTTTSPDTSSDEKTATKAETRATAQRDSEEKQAEEKTEAAQTAEKEQAETENSEPKSEDTAVAQDSTSPIDRELLELVGAETPEELYASTEKQARLMRELIRRAFPNRHRTMLAIANCESTGLKHWTKDGRLRPNSEGASSAGGVFQILQKTHRPEMRRLGLDPNDPRQYLQFARHLVERRPSLADWNASRGCWAPQVAGNTS